LLGQLLGSCLPAAKLVEAHPRDDRGEPAAEVAHVLAVGAAELQPRLLHGVVGVVRGAEHPVRDRAQVRAVLLEALGEPAVVGHVPLTNLGGRMYQPAR
jgi:hypothetical protein